MDAVTLKNFPKPYTAQVAQKYNAYAIIFDKTEVGIIPFDHDINKILGIINGAYFEGYIQKERDITCNT